jgi:hypothetical protein
MRRPARVRRRLRHRPAGVPAGRSARRARRRVPPRRPGHLARPAAHHHPRHDPLRHRRSHLVGPAAPPADPPRRLARPRRRAARTGRHPDPTHRGPAAWGPRPATAVAVVLAYLHHTLRCGPSTAGVPAPLRPRTHLPPVQANAGLDRADTTQAPQYTWNNRDQEQQQWLRGTLAPHHLRINDHITHDAARYDATTA